MENLSEYKSTLADLNCNSKPLINVLTMLAEENIQYAPDVVKVIADHIEKVSPDSKLPGLYLIDSIVKNIGKQYLNHFSANIVSIFSSVFDKVDEKTRLLLFKLRQTWSDIFPNKILYAIDVQAKQMDPAWPITAQPPAASIHVNPKFFGGGAAAQKSTVPPLSKEEEEAKLKAKKNEVLQELFAKKQQCLLTQQLVERHKALQTAKQQSLYSENSDVQPPKLRTIDPRAVAKLNPHLSQRDPRLQKICAPNLINVSTVDKSVLLPTQTLSIKIPVTTYSITVPSNTTSSVCDINSDQSKTIVNDENSKCEKNSSENSSIVKNVDNSELEKKSEKVEGGDVNSDKNVDDKRKRKSEEVSKINSKKKLEVQSTTPDTSPKKNKESKKENSVKDKCDLESEIEKYSPYSCRKESPVKKEKQQPNSPSRYSKKSEKSKLRSVISSPKNKKSEKSSSKHKDDLDTSKRLSHSADLDTDLRILNHSDDNDHGIKSIKREVKKEKDFDEPPEKKSRNDDHHDLFGSEDVDYRQLDEDKFLSDIKNSQHKGWAQYKASHPDEFKSPLRPAREKMDGVKNKDYFENDNGDDLNKQFQNDDSFGDSSHEHGDKFDKLSFSKPRYNHNPRIDWRRNAFRRDHYFRGGGMTGNRRFHQEPKFGHSFFNAFNSKDMIRIIDDMYQNNRIKEDDYIFMRRELEKICETEKNRHLNEGVFQKHNQGRNSPITGYAERGRLPFEFHNFKPHQGGMPPNIQGPMKPQPTVKAFRLDKKMCQVHFVNERAVILTDNNVPKELTFRGPPTKVYIEGLKPITLKFDGKPVKFELDGAKISMRFGTPARELYINDVPYEGKFGGPPFEAMLENGRIYHIRLDGPPPQVKISDEPVHELYQHIINNGNFSVQPAIQSHEHLPVPVSDTEPYDVDMRDNNNSMVESDNRVYMPPCSSSEGIKDVDYRHMPDEKVFNEKPSFTEHIQQPQRPPQGYFENWKENRPPVSTENTYTDRLTQKPGDWHLKENTSFRPIRPDITERVPPLHPEWGTNELRPPFPNRRMEGGSRNTPPQDPSRHSDWAPHSEPRHAVAPEHVNRQWNENNSNQENWKPPNHPPPRPEHPRPYNIQRDGAHNFNKRPPYFEPPRGPPPREPIRPNFILPLPPPQRPQFNEGLVRQRTPILPLPNFVRNPREMPPLHNIPPPSMLMLPPPPKPPIHMQMPFMPPPPRPMLPQVNVSAPVVVKTEMPVSTSVSVPQDEMYVPQRVKPNVPISSEESSAVTTTQPAPEEAPTVDIATLFEKLLAAGIISKPVVDEPGTSTKLAKKTADEKEEIRLTSKDKDPDEESVPAIKLNLESLKKRYPTATKALYRGSQCASCGMRFKEIHSERYSRHLDWHFRVNRREKDGAKKAFSRKWYYEVENSLQPHFEEHEDLEERAPSFFELQADEKQYQTTEPVEVPSVKSSRDDAEVCAVCQESFELFWVDKEEEWHLRDAVREEDQVYHPSCYEDFKRVPEEPAEKCSDDPSEVADSIKMETDAEDIIKMETDTDEVAIDEEVKEVLYSTIAKTDEEIKKSCERDEKDGLEDETPAENDIKKEPEEEEEEEDKLEGKPGEEEVIGMISESEMEAEPETRPESEMVVLQSGGIVMKVRAQSIQPASPAPENTEEQTAASKDAADESEEEEFRPPTPDPRFKVLEPVKRGTEMSGLCCIM